MIYVIGLVAAFCTTISFLPQLIKILKVNDTSALSFNTYLIMCVGTFMWVIYGFLNKDIVVMVANIITFSLSLIILVKIIKNKNLNI